MTIVTPSYITFSSPSLIVQITGPWEICTVYVYMPVMWWCIFALFGFLPLCLYKLCTELSMLTKILQYEMSNTGRENLQGLKSVSRTNE